MSGLFASLQTSVAGLRAQSQTMSGISNNIANAGTVGYKKVKFDLSSVVTQGTTRTSYTAGGLRSYPMLNVDVSGPDKPSSSPTDLSIAGKGFFPVKVVSSFSNADPIYYTRAGRFRKNEGGYLQNPAGFFLQGWPTDQSGQVTGTNVSDLRAVRVSNLTSPAQKSTSIDVAGNLPATDPTASAPEHRVRVPIYDSLGVQHQVEFVFKRVATIAPNTGTWSVSIGSLTKASDGSNSVGAGTFSASPATLQFGPNGTPNGNPDIAINFSADFQMVTGGNIGDSASGNGPIAVNLGTASTADGLTMNEGEFFTYRRESNGIPHGSFQDVSISDGGIVTAIFNNGFKRDIYKIPLATFNNVNGLREISGNTYQESTDSGNVLLQTPKVGEAGAIISSNLEGSNVDIAEEFTDLIVTQNLYAGNTRAITSQDEMLNELLRIKR